MTTGEHLSTVFEVDLLTTEIAVQLLEVFLTDQMDDFSICLFDKPGPRQDVLAEHWRYESKRMMGVATKERGRDNLGYLTRV